MWTARHSPFVPAEAGTQGPSTQAFQSSGSPLPRGRTESTVTRFGKTKSTAAIAICETPSIRRLARRGDRDGEDRQQRAERHEEEHLAYIAAVEELTEDDRRDDASDVEAARDEAEHAAIGAGRRHRAHDHVARR